MLPSPNPVHDGHRRTAPERRATGPCVGDGGRPRVHVGGRAGGLEVLGRAGGAFAERMADEGFETDTFRGIATTEAVPRVPGAGHIAVDAPRSFGSPEARTAIVPSGIGSSALPRKKPCADSAELLSPSIRRMATCWHS